MASAGIADMHRVAESLPNSGVQVEKGDMRHTIIQGNALDVLRDMQDGSVDCVVTSPPYLQCRDYGRDTVCDFGDWRGQLGHEPTADTYIRHLVAIFKECARVLARHGTMFIVIGDKYSGSRGTGVKPRSLCSVPARLQIAVCDDVGLILRSVLIWHKPDAIPSSASNRFTVDYEFVLFFAKSDRHYFKQQFEPLASGNYQTYPPIGGKKRAGKTYSGGAPPSLPLGRNMRSVWTLGCSRFSAKRYGVEEEHCAVYPVELARRCIAAGCPVQVCSVCSTPVVERVIREPVTAGIAYSDKTADHVGASPTSALRTKETTAVSALVKVHCGCVAPKLRGIVLDPFGGTGTTSVAAELCGVDSILIEISPAYCEMAARRIKVDCGMYAQVEVKGS